MKEDFVTYDLAVKLKDKGFDEYCEYGHFLEGSKAILYTPTIYQVLKWLREEKNLHIEIISAAYGYIYIISDTPNNGGTDRAYSKYRGSNDAGAWDDYNECVFDAIEYVIDNLI